MNIDSLHDILLARLEVAQRFTKDYQADVKKWITDYEAETPKIQSIEELIDRDQRYQYTAKVIFDNVEKYRSSFFENPPEVMYSKKGANDEEKARKIEAAWDYLKEKINFKQFMDDSFTYFGLCGFVSGHVGYKQEIETKKDEEGVEYVKYIHDDPFLEVYDYENEWFMPDSIFTPDAKEVSYFRKKKLTQSQVKLMFGKEVKADESVLTEDVTSEKDGLKSELLRVGVYYYFGTLPKRQLVEFMRAQAGEQPEEKDDEEADDGGESKQIVYAIFTKKEMLTVQESPIGETTCALGRWYRLPKKFFGFGLGKQLEEQQKQESIRIAQKVRYADLYSFPKLALDVTDAGNDPKQLMQRNNPVIQYRKNKPDYLVPPGSNGAVDAMINQNQQDIQTNSGLADISKMQKSNIIQTATGQTQVADSNEKRIKTAKDKYFEFLKQIIIKTFKYAQTEWQETKIQTITDENDHDVEVEISKEDFADIDFDKDIIINFENTTLNKDVMRQQSIVLYDKVKDDPIVDRSKVFKKMLKDGFGEKNPEQYIKESSVQPGMKFTGQDGQQYVADDSGTLVLQQQENQTIEGGGDMQPAANQMSVQTNPMSKVTSTAT